MPWYMPLISSGVRRWLALLSKICWMACMSFLHEKSPDFSGLCVVVVCLVFCRRFCVRTRLFVVWCRFFRINPLLCRDIKNLAEIVFRLNEREAHPLRQIQSQACRIPRKHRCNTHLCAKYVNCRIHRFAPRRTRLLPAVLNSLSVVPHLTISACTVYVTVPAGGVSTIAAIM